VIPPPRLAAGLSGEKIWRRPREGIRLPIFVLAGPDPWGLQPTDLIRGHPRPWGGRDKGVDGADQGPLQDDFKLVLRESHTSDYCKEIFPGQPCASRGEGGAGRQWEGKERLRR